MPEITGTQSVVFDKVHLSMVDQGNSSSLIKLNPSSPIGMYDSGVGGLTVLAQVMAQLPKEEVIYFGDTARVPYGGRTPNEILKFNYEIMDYLVASGAKIVIIACGTSSAIAYPIIKDKYQIPIIPLIDNGANAAVSVTENKKIGVIATQATINSSAYKREINKISNGIEVFEIACPMFVPLIEGGFLESEETVKIAKEYLKPLKREGIDTLILGCTHYPHLSKILRDIMGINIKFVDPAKEAVLRANKILEAKNMLNIANTQKPEYKYFVSGSVSQFRDVGSKLAGYQINNVKQVII